MRRNIMRVGMQQLVDRMPFVIEQNLRSELIPAQEHTTCQRQHEQRDPCHIAALPSARAHYCSAASDDNRHCGSLERKRGRTSFHFHSR